MLEGAQLAALLEMLLDTFPLEAGAEITVEANPNDLDDGRLRVLRSLGVNRLSLGVQSLADRDLRWLGRAHTVRQALEALDRARAHGFTNVGIDLLYGIPGQDESAWAEVLEAVTALRPEHLSCYQLTPEPHTPLGARVAAGELSLPGEEASAALFDRTDRTLVEAGYLHYEISNFAREPGFVSGHNRKYWRRVPYLGLGPSAHSFDGGHRWWNVRDLDGYNKALAAGALPVEASERLSDEQIALEELALSLRTREGVPLTLLGRFPRAARVVPALVREGVLALVDGRIAPTSRGMRVADRLCAAIL